MCWSVFNGDATSRSPIKSIGEELRLLLLIFSGDFLRPLFVHKLSLNIFSGPTIVNLALAATRA